jgi:hypothetical protein
MLMLVILAFLFMIVLVGVVASMRGPQDKGPWRREPFNDTWRGHQCDYLSESSSKRCVYFLGHSKTWPHNSHVSGEGKTEG